MNVSTDFKPVLTRAAMALQKKQGSSSANFTALVFQEPQGQATAQRTKPELGAVAAVEHDSSSSQKKGSKDDANDDDENVFDIKKARHEVLKFAMSNQRVIKNKRKMQIFQMVKLGAKPPKKAYKNYKELQDERKRLKDIREQRKKFHQLGKTQTGAASVKCRTKSKQEQTQKKRAPVSNIDQHYGRAQPKFKKKK